MMEGGGEGSISNGEHYEDIAPAFQHASSANYEAESLGRPQTPVQPRHQLQQRQNLRRDGGEEGDSLIERPDPHPDEEYLYNFKGFMLFCFGAPGVAPKLCSFLLFFYYVLLFTVGIGMAILGAVELPDGTSYGRPLVRANILVILTGLLYILAAFYGGCVWAWRAKAVPGMQSCCFPLLCIVVLLLSFAHVALTSAFVSVMIGYGDKIIHPNTGTDAAEFPLSTPTTSTLIAPGSGEVPQFYLLGPATLGTLVIWGVCFVVGLIPAFVLFRKRHRPRNNLIEE